jgi:hypothetical protein
MEGEARAVRGREGSVEGAHRRRELGGGGGSKCGERGGGPVTDADEKLRGEGGGARVRSCTKRWSGVGKSLHAVGEGQEGGCLASTGGRRPGRGGARVVGAARSCRTAGARQVKGRG